MARRRLIRNLADERRYVMASNNSKSGTAVPAPSDDDWQKGVPYAKADPYQGPAGDPYPGTPEATVRKSVVRPNGTTITGGLRGIDSTPITMEEFNKLAHGGKVKPWQKALAAHHQRKPTPRRGPKTRGNW
jgi:hypothetical protein